MRKGSKEAKAWGRKMKRLRGTRKGMRRKTARRAYTGLKRRRTRTTWLTNKEKSDSAWSW